MSHDITKRCRKTIWRPFLSAIKQYGLIESGDRIAVCVSGGKDSLLLAVIMSTLQKYSLFPFELVYLSMDPGYSDENRSLIQSNWDLLGLELESFNTDIFSVIDTVDRSPCHVCAAMRRGHLYKEAKLRGCNKIALGHHFDDVTETALLSLFYAGEFKTMPPKAPSDHFEGMELIRPLYHVREKEIINWQKHFKIQNISCACRVTKREDGGKRMEIKRLLHGMEKQNAQIPFNIFAALKKRDVFLAESKDEQSGRDETDEN